MYLFFKQKTAFEMRICDWCSDVCSSDLCGYDLFDLDAMAPIVPEIIGVGEAGNAALDELADAHMGGVAGADHEIIVVEADAIGGIADIEPEQVVVLEEHAGLDREVQGLEAIGGGKFEAAPEGGLQVFERDANQIGRAHV